MKGRIMFVSAGVRGRGREMESVYTVSRPQQRHRVRRE